MAKIAKATEITQNFLVNHKLFDPEQEPQKQAYYYLLILLKVHSTDYCIKMKSAVLITYAYRQY